MPRFLLPCLALAALLFAGGARAAVPEPRPVVVLAIAPGVAELDAAKMRAAVARELEAEAVSPDDTRAVRARGRLDLSIDRGTRELVVSYRGGAEPLERRVRLPADAAAIAREAVLLAGNLARDEAGELVAQLRKAKPARPSDEPLSPEDQAELAREDQLRQLLAAYARRDRALRLGLSWSLLPVGVAAAGVGLYLDRSQPSSQLGPNLLAGGALVAAVSAYSLLRPSEFERMSSDYASKLSDRDPRPWVREELEQRWKRSADNEHNRRLGGVGALIGLGLADGAICAFVLPRLGGEDRTHALGVGIAVAAVGGGLGVVVLTTETPVEARLHAYERALGHPIEPAEIGLRLAPVPGGLMAGLGGRF